jgi:hypothetical protein
VNYSGTVFRNLRRTPGYNASHFMHSRSRSFTHDMNDTSNEQARHLFEGSSVWHGKHVIDVVVTNYRQRQLPKKLLLRSNLNQHSNLCTCGWDIHGAASSLQGGIWWEETFLGPWRALEPETSMLIAILHGVACSEDVAKSTLRGRFFEGVVSSTYGGSSGD